MKSGTYFHFKKFSIAHDRCIHKVGTDGVLLGAWVNIENCKRVLDIGTGSGVIALMIAQRTPADTVIEAVEIEKTDADQAHENADASPWKEKVHIHNTAIQDFSSEQKFDLIVSNPPFFINSYLPPGKRRTQARHTSSLSYEELLSNTARLLAPSGRLGVILPEQEALQFTTLALRYELHCNRKASFRTRAHKPVERWLMEFSFRETESNISEILLYDGSAEDWSEDYRTLTKEFYLKI